MLRKQRICNDQARVFIVSETAKFIKKNLSMGYNLSQRVCDDVKWADQNFAKELKDQAEKTRIFREKRAEQGDCKRKLGYAVNDAKMGVIRHARRHERPPAELSSTIIHDLDETACGTTHPLFTQARCLISHNQNYDHKVEITNPTIVELIERLDKAVASTIEAERAAKDKKEAEERVRSTRAFVDNLLRQLNMELTYHLRGKDRMAQIRVMGNYGYRWKEPVCKCDQTKSQ